MKTQRFIIILTAINLVILVLTVMQVRSIASESNLPVLRGRGLEIVDDQGRKRAEIIVTAPVTMPDGQYYAESTLLRLIDPNGRPGVKIGTSVDGTGVSLAGDSQRNDWSGVQILAHSNGCSVKLTNRDGRMQEIKP